MYMHMMKDPVNELLCWVSEMHATMPLCAMHSNEEFMTLAVKVTKIIHEIYPTEDDNLGYYVDNDHFSFEGKSTLTTHRRVKETHEKIVKNARKAGEFLQNEHRIYDCLIRESVEQPFSATWFEASKKLYECGPCIINMPADLIGAVLAKTMFTLDDEHETLFDLKIIK